jgi:hypothetical protein
VLPAARLGGSPGPLQIAGGALLITAETASFQVPLRLLNVNTVVQLPGSGAGSASIKTCTVAGGSLIIAGSSALALDAAGGGHVFNTTSVSGTGTLVSNGNLTVVGNSTISVATVQTSGALTAAPGVFSNNSTVSVLSGSGTGVLSLSAGVFSAQLSLMGQLLIRGNLSLVSAVCSLSGTISISSGATFAVATNCSMSAGSVTGPGSLRVLAGARLSLIDGTLAASFQSVDAGGTLAFDAVSGGAPGLSTNVRSARSGPAAAAGCTGCMRCMSAHAYVRYVSALSFRLLTHAHAGNVLRHG